MEMLTEFLAKGFMTMLSILLPQAVVIVQQFLYLTQLKGQHPHIQAVILQHQ